MVVYEVGAVLHHYDRHSPHVVQVVDVATLDESEDLQTGTQ